jgi:hypothetical protein
VRHAHGCKDVRDAPVLARQVRPPQGETGAVLVEGSAARGERRGRGWSRVVKGGRGRVMRGVTRA